MQKGIEFDYYDISIDDKAHEIFMKLRDDSKKYLKVKENGKIGMFFPKSQVYEFINNLELCNF